MQSQKKFDKIFSFELFPPKTDAGVEKLHLAVTELSTVNPAYFSVTYGAGGSTQERTFETVDWLCSQGITTAPHLSCIGSRREEILKILKRYQQQGVHHLVALRGDMPSGMGDSGDFRYANELVEYIRAETGDLFHLEVAAYPEFHPQAASATDDLQNFVRKVKSGANSAITQYFYNADAYLRFVESCEKLGLDIPIIPGIMPINNYPQLARFSQSCGTEIPRWLHQRMEAFGEDDPEGARAYGLDAVTALCGRLLEIGAPGLHFYTMNQSDLPLTIWKNLGLPER